MKTVVFCIAYLIIVIIIADLKFLKCEHTLTQVPESRNKSGIHIFICKFNTSVDCFWKINNITSKISNYNYEWVTGDGRDTKDCSIQSNKSYKTIRNITCYAIIIDSTTSVQLGNRIQLNCSSQKLINCSWYKNYIAVNISDRYKFAKNQNGFNVYDCSLLIESIQILDIARWDCNGSSSQFTEYVIKRYYLNINKESSSTTDSTLPEPTSSAGPTIKNIQNLTENNHFQTQSTPSVKPNPTTDVTIYKGNNSSPRPITYEPVLGFVGIISLIVVIIIFILKYVRRKNRKKSLKRKNTQTANRRVSSIEYEIQPYAVSESYTNFPNDADVYNEANGYLIPNTLIQAKPNTCRHSKTNYYNSDVSDLVENHIYEEVDNSTNT